MLLLFKDATLRETPPTRTTLGTSLRVTLLRRYRYANTSRLRRETRLQRWIHRNAVAPQYPMIND
ncbi:hypothetical protein [Nostoc sp.]|uniref:hypothetical protein n=1 Tax=Nostoc sp. TaxID=1180 RepID=UPI002FFC88BA